MSNTSLSALRIRKLSSSSIVDLEDSPYKMRLTECPMLFAEEAKDTPHIDYPEQDGIDTYESAEVKMKAFEATFNLAFIANSPTDAHMAVKWLLDYVTKGGALHDVYSPWAGTGRTRCRFKKLGKPSQHRNSSNEFVWEFSITFMVEDPTTDINPF